MNFFQQPAHMKPTSPPIVGVKFVDYNPPTEVQFTQGAIGDRQLKLRVVTEKFGNGTFYFYGNKHYKQTELAEQTEHEEDTEHTEETEYTKATEHTTSHTTEQSTKHTTEYSTKHATKHTTKHTTENPTEHTTEHTEQTKPQKFNIFRYVAGFSRKIMQGVKSVLRFLRIMQ